MAECRSAEMAVGVILRNLGAVELRQPRHMIQMTGLRRVFVILKVQGRDSEGRRP